MIANSISRDDATRFQTDTSNYYDYIGFNPELAIRMSKPTRTLCPYWASGGGTLDQELHAAPAKSNNNEVELWLIDTGCAHDLVSFDDIAHTGDKLCTLQKILPLRLQM
eukprot:12307031-Heterocapsa_arctica.AAC.1